VSALERELVPERSARDLFGFEVRRLRRERGLSLGNLAGQLCYSKTHLGNVETADRAIPPDLPARLDSLLETDGVFERLYALVHLESFPDWSRRFLELEGLASEMRLYVSGAFPGLWQTGEYGRALLRVGLPRASDAEVEQAWLRREKRQAILTGDSPPLVWVVLDESVVRRPVGGPAVMRGQINHVLELVAGRQAVVQVLPFTSGGHPLMGSSLTLLSFLDAPRVAYAEGIDTGVLREASAGVMRMALYYDLVSTAALPPPDSVAWLHDAIKDTT
jgi:transcriptional regulator with XRE-family HTH domain